MALWITATCAPVFAAPVKPNIIFILCDDLGYGDTGVFFQKARALANVRSEPSHFTPNLDTLAAEGTQLRHHYCPAPVCAPSRASLLLGVHQGHANVRDNQFDKALENNHTLGTVLKQAGYATATIGKWGLQGSGGTPALWPAYPTKRGFDYFYGYVRHGDGHEHYPKNEPNYSDVKEVWDGTNEVSSTLDRCYTGDLWTARAKKWIMDQRRTNSTAPFFLYLAYDTPHAVLELPTQVYPAGGGTNGGLQWLDTPGHMINTATGTADSYIHPAYANQTWDDDNNSSTPEVAWKDVYKRFATSVRRIDDALGDLKILLQQLNIDTNTIIVFSSDNGPSIESYLSESYAANFFNSFGPFDGIKRDLWEGGVRMPTIARWPGQIPAGTTNNTPSQFHDWLPTFAELAGIPAPARSDGVSLVPSLTGVSGQRTPTVYVEYYHDGTTPSYGEFASAHRSRTRKQMQSIRMGDLIGVRYNVTSHADNFEIYNVVTDPQESVNLATNAAFAALQQQMKDKVLRLRRPEGTAARPYDGEFVPAANPVPVTVGVEWKSFTNVVPWVPELTSLTSISNGVTNTITLSVRPQDNNIGLLFSGFILAPVDGSYTFYLTADSGALLRIHEATVIDADFGYVSGTERSGTIKLKAGKHPYRLYYARTTNGAPTLTWSWSGPGMAKEPVAASSLFITGAAPPGPPFANRDMAATTQNTPVLIDVLANDSDDGTPQSLSIQSVTMPAGGTNQIQGNNILYRPATNFLGQDIFFYSITDGSGIASAKVSVDVYFTNSDFIWFPLNQSSDLTTAEAGGRMLGNLRGFNDTTSQWVTGRFGYGLELDGVSSYVAVDGSYLPPSGTSPRTTSAWIKVPPGTTTGSIMAWGPNSTSRKWMMRLDTAGPLRLEVGGGYIVATGDLRDGLWHHVAAVLPAVSNPNATNVLLYVDGVRQTNVTLSASPINTDSVAVTIGLDAQNRFFQGTIDEPRIYRRALSASEIATLAAAGNQSAAAWYRRYYGDVVPDWENDSDGDGNTQLAEYAFGGNPRVQDTLPKLSLQLTGDQLRLEYCRLQTGSTELLYRLETSSNLNSWSVLAGTESSAEPSAIPGYEIVQFTSGSIASLPQQFIRVQAANSFANP